MQNHKLIYQSPHYIPTITIYVKIQRQVVFGRALYLVGNCPQLGNWNLQRALRLNWGEGNYWRKSVEIQSKAIIQYKYVEADFECCCSQNTIWQCGVNRFLPLENVNGNSVYLNERWNLTRMRIELICQSTQQVQEVSVIGNIIDLGLNVSPRSMKKLRKISWGANTTRDVYGIIIFVDKQKQFIQYNYVINRQKQNWTRFHSLTKAVDSNNQHVFYKQVPAEIYILDIQRSKSFVISQITERLYLGPCVRGKADIQSLKQKNIAAVINLQTRADMQIQKIDWQYLKTTYEQHNIQVHNLGIVDMKANDFIIKCPSALLLLRCLLESHQKIYIHCTAGIFRSSQLIVLYLILYEKYSIREAMEFVKQRREICKPNQKIIKRCLDYINSVQDSDSTCDGQLEYMYY